MNPMKRLSLLLLLNALLLSFVSCQSESKPDAAAAPGASPEAAGVAPNAESTPPPGAVEVSEATFQKELQQNPEDPVAHYNLGTVYHASGKFAEAAEEFKAVAAKEPQNVDAFAKMGIAYASTF